ncbi:PTS sugar transporter subunit IIA [Infirmifilum sp. NZ]|uniref:PTS sugar transporter subunit IIA n=1 Tax=Infirmifilum sp. NZ TaxID=2926850 RepID=UPI0027A305BF|nr:PTS sugar transporter subunit IIA [Infirmifilum sp. NZ]UNQ73257.1 PTS sugar transporter subunit IIA [Infirmifilum sp. NZ]
MKEQPVGFLEALGGRVVVVEGVSGWEGAVALSGRLLLEGGCVEERYIGRMVSTCRELGPYIAIAPGIAIPHARPEDGARRVCLSLVVVRSGVSFGSHNDPVYVLIAFSTPDKHSHIKVLQELANLLTEKGEELVRKLREAKNREEALQKLRELLRDSSLNQQA